MSEISKSISYKRGNYLIDYIAKHREMVPLIIIALYFISYSIIYTDIFPTAYNLTSMVLEWATPAILVSGTAIVLISGEIDLSISYNIMFSGMVCGTLIVLGLPIWLVIIITLIISLISGFIIGMLVTRLRINSFIATLAAGNVYYGLSQFIYNRMFSVKNAGASITELPDKFNIIGRFQLVKGLNIQIPIVYAVIISGLALYLVGSTVFFKKYYYIGSNNQAAILSGINLKKLKTISFMISSLMASIVGIVLAARYGASTTGFGLNIVMQTITACVIGGISIAGGTGTIKGALIGAFFVVCLNNALRISEIPSNLYNIVLGLFLLLAVTSDAVFARRKVIG